MKPIIKLLNSKKVYSIFSEHLVTFVDSLSEISENQEGAFSDGMTLIDTFENVEDDIQQMYFVLKDGSIYNCEDFYSDMGAYSPGSNFIDNIKNLVADR